MTATRSRVPAVGYITHHASRITHGVSFGRMRTTLSLDDDVLISAKEIARRQKRTAGEVISELARIGLRQTNAIEGEGRPSAFLGFEPIASNGRITTNDDVNRLRAELGD